MIVVEVEGLELFAHHGADEAERERGQTFLFDVRIEIADVARSDRLADTIDYVAVVELVAMPAVPTRDLAPLAEQRAQFGQRACFVAVLLMPTTSWPRATSWERALWRGRPWRRLRRPS